MNDSAITGRSLSPTTNPKVVRSSAFITTRWSLVVTAGQPDASEARSALTRLCQTYWYPLYVYVRRRGHSPDDARDLTQDFFTELLAKNWVADADQTKGRFRSFLLGTMNHFLSDAWDKTRAQKRGGGMHLIPLQLDTAETRFGHERADGTTPEKSFERRWAMTLLDEVLDQLRTSYALEGKADLFAVLTPCLVGDHTLQPYAKLAQTLGTTAGTVKSAVHRLRQNYRQKLREEIAHTVSTPQDVDEEMRYLFSILAME